MIRIIIFYPMIKHDSILGRAMKMKKNFDFINVKVGEILPNINRTYKNLTLLPQAAKINRIFDVNGNECDCYGLVFKFRFYSLCSYPDLRH